jgi:hypothetical protein
MAVVLQPATERHTDNSHSFHIRRIIVRKGFAQFARRAAPRVSIARRIWIPRSLQAVAFANKRFSQSLSSITFESDSRLTRIESSTFSRSSLQSIIIPRNVELLCSLCFIVVNHFHQSHLNQIQD